MKVFLKPTGLHSRAMNRVAAALATYKPSHVQVTEDREAADLVVSHVIGPEIGSMKKREIVIQYCLRSAGLEKLTDWLPRWRDAALVWSYYDLPSEVRADDFNFYHSPLGVDAAFTQITCNAQRNGVMTSGYVSSHIGEAIEEVAIASWMLDIPVTHLGPQRVEGMRVQTPRWRSVLDISDEELALHYWRSKWVSGLRQVEGFEMPVIEGLCCGARPIVFDRADMRQWYEGHAIFVPECSGVELVRELLDVLDEEPEPVTEDERQWAIQRFDWKPIVEGFWERVQDA